MAANTHQHFKYEPLNQPAAFRLLLLEPGKDEDAITCKLQIHHLSASYPLSMPKDSTPPFEAISYVWGSADLIHTIECNEKPLRITANLRQALLLLRCPSRPVFVWADAICIDQSDLKERRVQVDLMERIYSRAKRVSVCLRVDDALSTQEQHALAKYLRALGPLKYARRKFSQRWAIPDERAVAVESSYSDTPPTAGRRSPGYSPGPRQLRRKIIWNYNQYPQLDERGDILPLSVKFFDNPWFNRIWVIQEVSDSSKTRVGFGKEFVPFQNVLSLAAQVRRHPLYTLLAPKTKGVQNVLSMASDLDISAHEPLLALLQATRDFKASDPRDKVYAVLHRPVKRPRTRHKYYSTLDQRKYLEVLVQMLTLLHLLFGAVQSRIGTTQFWYMFTLLMSMAYFTKQERAVWIIVTDVFHRFVNFCVAVDQRILHQFKHVQTLHDTFSISADYSLTVNSVFSKIALRSIQLSGSLDVLSYTNHVSAINTSYPSWVPQWDLPTEGVQLLVAFPGHQYTAAAGIRHNTGLAGDHADYLVVEGISFSSISWISDVITLSQSSQPVPKRRERDQDNDTSLSGSTTATPWRRCLASFAAERLVHGRRRLAPPSFQDYQQCLASAHRICHGRRAFTLENEYVGIGAAAMKVGDIVCILFGGKVPYILRPTDRTGMYRLVGECYVHGIMQGEVVGLSHKIGLKKDRFVLS
ncbi:hypothetical protein P152DRAFT_455687 [Eremomyces bilateralis CBS 781.70]|uniref:Heterokaryon incompatibility domain-containing protein n=1 Tax=Eremomyces bilateralis CBS 781.70 TaxID=1392243 RepID=A0A6G1GD61_9PEZI|nr:uncharacterized protein P152DRAFT_455687 [Eremomyces bilateralis CBS 781.70]KAF1815964.1 hypothetical protein P152DRAFT_455687 [Eremomyces bilateralis CBS 781.70]